MLFFGEFFSHSDIRGGHVVGTHWEAFEVLFVIFAQGCLLIGIEFIELHARGGGGREREGVGSGAQDETAPRFEILVALPPELAKIILIHFVIIIELPQPRRI